MIKESVTSRAHRFGNWREACGKATKPDNIDYLTGDVPGHSLGMRTNCQKTRRLIADGILEQVGKVFFYIDGRPQEGVVVRVIKTAGIAAAAALVVYESVRRVRRRGEKTKKG